MNQSTIKKVLVGVLVLIAIIIAVELCYAQDSEVQLGFLVDDYIQHCKAKEFLIQSASTTIKNDAIDHCKQAEFILKYRTELIKEMMKEQIEPKKYKVYHFLNGKSATD